MQTLSKEQLLDQNKGLDEFTRSMGISFTCIEPGYACSEMNLSSHLVNPLDSVHGGAIFTLADVTAGVAITAKRSLVTTVDASIHYVNAAFLNKTNYLHAKTREIKCGKKIGVYDVDITDDNSTLIATARMTFYVLPQKA